MQILLIHADPVFSAGLGDALERLGATVDYAANDRLGVRMTTSRAFDAIVLAADLPGTDGLRVCRTLRETLGVYTPLMMVGPVAGVQPTVAALQAGADDYRAQPLVFEEVHARLRALARGYEASGVLEIGDLRFDTVTKRVHRCGERLHPTPIGLKLLRLLMEAAPRLVTHAELEARVWGRYSACRSEANLRVQIHALRAVIDKPFDQPLIRTYRSAGYRMAGHGEAPTARASRPRARRPSDG